MPRLRRAGLFLLALLSLLALSATLLLWHRSHRGPDYVHYTSSRQFAVSLISGHGTIDVLVIPRWAQEPELRRGRYDPNVYYGTRYSKRFLGFGTAPQWPEHGGLYVNIPHWFVASASALSTLLFARAAYRGRTRPPGHCPACRYDLRATPDRCPECGSSAPTLPLQKSNPT